MLKPPEMAWLLSVKTVFPRKGAQVWHQDQREVHRHIYGESQYGRISARGQDPLKLGRGISQQIRYRITYLWISYAVVIIENK